jgi:hypothetical protein
MNSPRDLVTALSKKSIQFNPPGFKSFIVIDCDYENAKDGFKSSGLPVPTWTATNPANGHAHLIYALTATVWTGGDNQAPANYFKAVQLAYTEALRGDEGYVHLLTKNPLNPCWQVDSECDYKTYDLKYLASFVVLKKKAREVKKVAVEVAEGNKVGRNCMIFDQLREWAYTAVAEYKEYIFFLSATTKHAGELNAVLQDGLSDSEIRGISKSVAKWVFDKYRKTGESFSKLQRARQVKSVEARVSKSAEKRLQAVVLLTEGLSMQKIAEAIGVSRRTVYTWLADR